MISIFKISMQSNLNKYMLLLTVLECVLIGWMVWSLNKPVDNYMPTHSRSDLTMRGFKLAKDDAGICTIGWRLVIDNEPLPTCCHYPFCVTKHDDGKWYVTK